MGVMKEIYTEVQLALQDKLGEVSSADVSAVNLALDFVASGAGKFRKVTAFGEEVYADTLVTRLGLDALAESRNDRLQESYLFLTSTEGFQSVELSTTCDTCTEDDFCDCLDNDLIDLQDLLDTWAMNSYAYDTTEVVFDGRVGWDSGRAVFSVDSVSAGKFFRALANTDCRLVFTLDPMGTTLSVMRYSHDEPTGASLAITLVDSLDN